MRVALYYLPDPDDPLWAAGCAWLGWDSRRAHTVQRPQIPNLVKQTARASHYGLHATIKAPMASATTLEVLLQSLRREIPRWKSFVLPSFCVSLEGGFLSLRLSNPCGQLQDFAAHCVRFFDRFRQPHDAVSLARRVRSEYSARQLGYLQQWGYPHVFEDFIFHLTLSDKNPSAALSREAFHYFAPYLTISRTFSAIHLLLEEEPDKPMTVVESCYLGVAASKAE